MKRLWALLLLCLGLEIQPAQGMIMPPPPGAFEFSAEWIFFKPRIDNNYYALISSNIVPALTGYIGKRLLNDELDFQSGLRLAGNYAFLNHPGVLSLCWTHFNSSNEKIFFGRAVSDEINIDTSPGFYFNTVKILVNSADLLYRHLIYEGGNLSFWGGGGVQYAHLFVQDDTRVDVTPSINVFRQYLQTSRLDGVGPEVVLHGAYTFPFWQAVSAVIKGCGALLVSRHDHTTVFSLATNTSVISPFLLEDQKLWRVVPFFDLKLGLNIRLDVDVFPFRFPMQIEFGYEVMDYVRSFYRLDFRPNPDGGTQFSETYSDLSFHGPFLNVGISF